MFNSSVVLSFTRSLYPNIRRLSYKWLPKPPTGGGPAEGILGNYWSVDYRWVRHKHQQCRVKLLSSFWFQALRSRNPHACMFLTTTFRYENDGYENDVSHSQSNLSNDLELCSKRPDHTKSMCLIRWSLWLLRRIWKYWENAYIWRYNKA
jgi:hypothetical protein